MGATVFDRTKSGELKIANLSYRSMPQRIEGLIGEYTKGFGKDPERLIINSTLYNRLVVEHLDYLRYLNDRFTIVAVYVPVEKLATDALLVVCNDSGTKYIYI